LPSTKAPEAKVKLRSWFEEFGIQDWWKKKVEDLSKGMAQKVQFIATVVHEPKLLILDEPFTGFDPVNENLVKDKILSLKAKGTTIIFSTHRMESVEELCSHIALINKAEKVLDGSTSEIRSRYRSHTWKVTGAGSWPVATGLVPNKVKDLPDGLSEWTVQLPAAATTNDLLATILPIVILAKSLAVVLDFGIIQLGAPVALGGILIAMVVFTPECIAALRASAMSEARACAGGAPGGGAAVRRGGV
jgi:ABC-2 type transport system ATP-binding protein